MPRNTTGGKNFKKFKTGAEGFRAKAAREEADDMLDLIRKVDRYGKDGLAPDDREALLYMFVGRVTKRFGHGRMEVMCHDGISRQCRIRGLLRKRGQVFIDIDHLVVVSTREAVESDSDDETGVKSSNASGGATADIIGLFNEKQSAILRKTTVNPSLFVNAKGLPEEEDLFDRSELTKGEELNESDSEAADGLTKKPAGRADRAKAATAKKATDEVDIDDI